MDFNLSELLVAVFGFGVACFVAANNVVLHFSRFLLGGSEASPALFFAASYPSFAFSFAHPIFSLPCSPAFFAVPAAASFTSFAFSAAFSPTSLAVWRVFSSASRLLSEDCSIFSYALSLNSPVFSYAFSATLALATLELSFDYVHRVSLFHLWSTGWALIWWRSYNSYYLLFTVYWLLHIRDRINGFCICQAVTLGCEVSGAIIVWTASEAFKNSNSMTARHPVKLPPFATTIPMVNVYRIDSFTPNFKCAPIKTTESLVHTSDGVLPLHSSPTMPLVIDGREDPNGTDINGSVNNNLIIRIDQIHRHDGYVTNSSFFCHYKDIDLIGVLEEVDHALEVLIFRHSDECLLVPGEKILYSHPIGDTLEGLPGETLIDVGASQNLNPETNMTKKEEIHGEASRQKQFGHIRF
nr:hypothetical protein Iba_chr13dCG1740 [Ipomoea batatas]